MLAGWAMLLFILLLLTLELHHQSQTDVMLQDTLRGVADVVFLLMLQMQYLQSDRGGALQYTERCCRHLLLALLQMQYSQSDGGVAPRYDEGEDMVRQLQANQTGVDDRLHQSQIQLFKDRQLITSGDQIDGEALDVIEGAQEGESSSEGGESDAEGDSDDDSEEGDDEEEEGAVPAFRGMPQEQIEVGTCSTV